MTLSQARERAAELRKRVVAGERPRAFRGEAGIPTFGEFAEEYIAAHEGSWTNPKHRAQWRMTLSAYVKPLRRLPVNRVSVADVLLVLKPHWQRAPETAGRLRGGIEAVLDAAKAKGLRSGENPAAWKGNLKHLLRRGPSSRAAIMRRCLTRRWQRSSPT